jgi:PBSX family phage terminase large subunit
MIAGPAGTGKSRVGLQKLHELAALDKYAGMRGLITRKTRKSLTQSAMKTYEERVLIPQDRVRFHTSDQEYRYPNGSRLVVGGLDDPTKTFSAEYDVIYVQQAEEVTEDDWESLTRALRHWVMPYQQILGDCNPGPPNHWIRQRAATGQLLMLESRHEDNPLLFHQGAWTEEGQRYIALLDALTGVRKQRLRYGRWVAAEGVVYEQFDRAVHLIDRFDIPESWRRVRSVDFGYQNPFVCQWWAIDGDGRMYLYRELYQTQRLVADIADLINALSIGERIEATVADHDAEDRATLRAKGIITVPAYKAVAVGIQAVQDRLTVQPDGRPRLFVLRDALVERDDELADAGKPYCTEQEVDSYVWAKSPDGRPVKEEPMKLNDHGMDTMRYAVTYIDPVKKRSIGWA